MPTTCAGRSGFFHRRDSLAWLGPAVTDKSAIVIEPSSGVALSPTFIPRPCRNGRCAKPRRISRPSVVVLIAATMALCSIARASEVVSQADVLRTPGRFDGKHIQLRGTVGGLRGYTAKNGDTFVFFDLSNRLSSVRVVLDRVPACSDGAMATVGGTFRRAWPLGRVVHYNIVQATSVACEGQPPKDGVRGPPGR